MPSSNYNQLTKEGIIDDTNLTQAGRDALDNAPQLTDDEIEALKSVKAKLGLDPIPLEQPGGGIHIWHL